MSKGSVILLLHAHLPFVRHPEYPSFLEERWLFEAISETYLPLLRMLDRLHADDVPCKLSVSLSPTLVTMLADPVLQDRYVGYLDQQLDLADREVTRTRGDADFAPISRMYQDLFQQDRRDFVERYEKNILKGFDYYYKRGRLELLTTAATHAYLPLYQNYPVAVNAQIELAADTHRRAFGKSPKGFWLPECGYASGVEEVLRTHGFQYFLSAAHGLLFADQRPTAGVYQPVLCPNGVAVFARDLYSANAVWSADEGYPGDFTYRDFYRDIGYDLPIDYIGPFVHEGGIRISTGFKYYAITGKTDQKIPYQPDAAKRTVVEHAGNFLYMQRRLADKLEPLIGHPPVVLCPYDAELFGHWWFEGPLWLEEVIRQIADDKTLELTTPSEYLKAHQPEQTLTPAFSSWGNKGYSEVWLDGTNDWIYRHTHKVVERMQELVTRFPNETGLKQRALAQAAREALLAQCSDWPFIIRAGTNVSYAVRRIKEHVNNFTTIYDSLCRGVVSTEWLTRIEKKNAIFPDIDYRIFQTRSPASPPDIR